MAGTELNKCLRQFLKERGTPSVFDLLEKIRSDAKEIIQYVQARDPRFKGQITEVGSLSTGVSAVHIDECDMLLILEIPGTWSQERHYPNFARFKLDPKKTAWKDCMTKDGYLHPRYVADLLMEHVSNAVLSLPKLKDTRPTVSGEGTVATTISIEYLHLTVSIDLVIAIKCDGWPGTASPQWLQGKTRWPGPDTAMRINKDGFHLVAKSIYGGPKSTETLWRLSFSAAETLLLLEIDHNDEGVDAGAYYCHKELLKILKTLRKFKFSSPRESQTPIITSYHFKTLLFHESVAHPEKKDWTQDKLGERFLCAISSFLKFVREENLENFFVPSVNLFEERLGLLRTTESILEAILEDPIKFVEEMMNLSRNTIFGTEWKNM